MNDEMKLNGEVMNIDKELAKMSKSIEKALVILDRIIKSQNDDRNDDGDGGQKKRGRKAGKKRGRKAGVKVEKKKRGRKPKEVKEVYAGKKRGRKPKSKFEIPVIEESAVCSNDNSEEQETQEVPVTEEKAIAVIG